MAIAYVNSGAEATSGSSSTIAAAAINATTGNTIVVFVSSDTATRRSCSSLADTAGNTYTQCGSVYQGSSTHEMSMWVATNITGNASNIVTATFSGSAAQRCIGVLQYSGLAASSVYDVESTGRSQDYSLLFTTNATATTTVANEVVVGAWYIWTNSYADYLTTSAYNFRISHDFADDPALYTSMVLVDRIVSSTGTYSVSVNSRYNTNRTYSFAKSFKMASVSSTKGFAQFLRRYCS